MSHGAVLNAVKSIYTVQFKEKRKLKSLHKPFDFFIGKKALHLCPIFFLVPCTEPLQKKTKNIMQFNLSQYRERKQ